MLSVYASNRGTIVKAALLDSKSRFILNPLSLTLLMKEGGEVFVSCHNRILWLQILSTYKNSGTHLCKLVCILEAFTVSVVPSSLEHQLQDYSFYSYCFDWLVSFSDVCSIISGKNNEQTESNIGTLTSQSPQRDKKVINVINQISQAMPSIPNAKFQDLRRRVCFLTSPTSKPSQLPWIWVRPHHFLE